MKNISNKFHKSIVSRLTAVVALLAMGCLTSFADNRLYIEPFMIAPGETQQVKIILDNDDPITSLQFELTFQDGIKYVDNSFAYDNETNRVTKNSHTPMFNLFPNGSYKCGLLSKSSTIASSAISGSRGSIMTIEVEADPTFTGSNEAILIKGIVGSNGTAEPAVAIKMADVAVAVSAQIGNATADSDEIVTRPNTSIQVGVALNNNIEIANFQAIVTLPEGVSPVEEGEKVTLSSRVSDNVSYSFEPISGETNKYLLLVESIVGDVIQGHEGTLFTLNLVADKVMEDVITISDFEVSNTSGISFDVKSDINVKIKTVTDPTGDGVWNINDVYAVLASYESGIYESVCDVDGDGVININDIYAVIVKYNEAE